MKLRFISFEHITEAVKYLVSKKGEHLPYTDADGKPNHRLMGAAWAALHEGYRGQQYAGPDKSEAISKLKALYQAEGMGTPQESFSLDGEFFNESLPQSDSFDAVRSRVQAALDKAVRMGQDMDLDGDDDSAEGCYCWVRDLFPGSVVYSMDGDLFQVDYTDDGEMVTLGTPQEVEMSYTAVADDSQQDASEESHRVMATEVHQLAEAFDAQTGLITMTIIKPGFNLSKQRFYPPAVLKRDYKIFEGAKMFADHQTEKESKERPEGSVRDWVGTMKKVWAESDGTIKGQAAVIDPSLKAKLEELNKQSMLSDMGVSIRAIGEASKTKVQGTETNYIESLIRARSVDFVTYAGAGGRVETMESHNSEADVDLVSEAELRQRRPDLIELIEARAQQTNQQENTVKTLEQQLQESKTQLAAAVKEVGELKTKLEAAEKDEAPEGMVTVKKYQAVVKENEQLTKQVEEAEVAQKKANASANLVEMLKESKLPEAAQKRLQERFKDATSDEDFKEAITEEKEYIKSIGGKAEVRNMGEKHNATVSTDHKADLMESFLEMGLTKEQAAIAASGRRH